MKHKDAEYEQARELRRQGLSLREICRRVPAAKSSISLWIRDIPLTEEQIERLTDNRQRAQERAGTTKRLKRLVRVSEYHRAAEEEYMILQHDPHFMFGLALYIGEGSKSTKTEMAFVNWDPRIVSKALGFFLRIGIPKANIKCRITLHPAQDRAKAETFWSEELDIPLSQFTKTYQSIRPGSRGKRGQKWPHGGCMIRASSFALRHKLNRWMELALA